jgi:hypothetical protein
LVPKPVCGEWLILRKLVIRHTVTPVFGCNRTWNSIDKNISHD